MLSNSFSRLNVPSKIYKGSIFNGQSTRKLLHYTYVWHSLTNFFFSAFLSCLPMQSTQKCVSLKMCVLIDVCPKFITRWWWKPILSVRSTYVCHPFSLKFYFVLGTSGIGNTTVENLPAARRRMYRQQVHKFHKRMLSLLNVSITGNKSCEIIMI